MTVYDAGPLATPAQGGSGAITPADHRASAWLHAGGAGASLAGLPALLAAGAPAGPAGLAAAVVFSMALVFLYTTSAGLHFFAGRPVGRLFGLLDRAGIFIVIAGTYTPFALVVLPPAPGYGLLAGMWGAAAIGVALLAALHRQPRRWAAAEPAMLAIYVTMGWLGAVATTPTLVASLPAGGLAWLLVGGISYTGGAGIYARGRFPFYHACWHACVLAGSLCHYIAVLIYALPGGPT